MSTLKKISFILITFICLYSCNSSKLNNTTSKEQPVVIANDSLEYEIIIFDIGFNNFLNTIAQPEGYYSLNFLENKNRILVTNWNIRARNPIQYNPNIYANEIDYQSNIRYGYEVNYKLFNYFLFAQQKYNMNLGAGRLRIR